MALRRGTGAILAGLGSTILYRYHSVTERERNLPRQTLPVFDTVDSDRDTATKQRVLIVGAGVVGVSTAYKLAKLGHQVAILEPMSAPGEECSACAAGGMSQQNVVVDRNTWIAVLKCLAPPSVARWVFGGESTENDFKFFRISWASSLSDPFFLRWALTFTKTSLFPSDDQQGKQEDMLKFTKYAVNDMVAMFENRWDSIAKKAGYNARGSLAVSYDNSATNTEASTTSKDAGMFGSDSTKKNMSFTLEPNRHIESTEQILQEEPSLRFQVSAPTTAKFEYESKSASSGRFTKELARRCTDDPTLDVKFLYDTKVRGISTTPAKPDRDGRKNSKPRISEIRTNRGVIPIPEDVHVVVAAGAWTPHVLALMDLYAPVYPLKGYAMSVSAKEALQANPTLRPEDLPSRIVCDKYMYTTRLGDEIRFTSIGEFSEWNTQPTPHVDKNFRNEAIRQFPQLREMIPNAKTYCGHRPYVNDGILMLGAADTHERLYVSCGPGSNGWKLALGSGDIVARLISGQTTTQIKEELGFDPSSFSPAGRVLKAPLFAKICRARWDV